MIGKMRQKFTLQEQVITPDGAGGETVTWQNIANVWGRLVSVRGGNVLVAGQTENQVTHKIYIRMRGDMNYRRRLIKGTRIFDISIMFEADEKQRYMEIHVIERKNQ